MFPQNFRTQPFVQEELIRFTNALSKGRVSDLSSLVNEMTPEKETELQKLVNHFSPVFKGYEQKVKGFLEQLQIKESLDIVEPQQEQKIQELIDKELTFVKSKNKLEAAINELNSLKTASKEETTRVQDTIKEHKKMLKDLQASVNESITLENVRGILKIVTVTPERVLTPPVPKELPKEPVLDKKEESKLEDTVKEDAKGLRDAIKEEKELKTPEPSKSVVDTKLEELAKSEKPGEEIKIKEPTPPKVKESDGTGKLPEPVAEAILGSKARECCGSKGRNHKKACPTKQ